MPGLRRRTTCRESGFDENGDSTHVLDEQEQEEVLARLRRKVKKTNERSTLLLQGLVTSSAFTQGLFLISPSFFLNEKPIAAARFYILLNFVLHVNLMLVLNPELERWMGQKDPGFQFSEQDAWLISYFSLVPPIVSFICWRSWTQTIWWCSTAFLSASVRLGVRGIKEGEQSVKDVEKLRYELKGA